MQAIRVHEHGGPDVLSVEEGEIPRPGPGEVLIRHEAIGLNFIDTYHRSGLYPLPLPFTPGLEAAGVVEEAGEGVTRLKAGDRVAYGAGPVGAYAQYRTIAAGRVAKLPDAISFETAAAMMLKGLTAWYLLREAHRVRAGETIVFLPAAGGVGLIAGQWARALGARAIGVCSAAKREIALAHGYAEVIDYTTQDMAKEVRALTGGAGVPVVYDGVGAATFLPSLDCLSPRGLLVSFGNASGAVKNVDLNDLAARGSAYVTRPVLMDYVRDDADLARASEELFGMVASGKVKVTINQRYPLAQAARAHADLQTRKTTGQTILIP